MLRSVAQIRIRVSWHNSRSWNIDSEWITVYHCGRWTHSGHTMLLCDKQRQLMRNTAGHVTIAGHREIICSFLPNMRLPFLLVAKSTTWVTLPIALALGIGRWYAIGWLPGDFLLEFSSRFWWCIIGSSVCKCQEARKNSFLFFKISRFVVWSLRKNAYLFCWIFLWFHRCEFSLSIFSRRLNNGTRLQANHVERFQLQDTDLSGKDRGINTCKTFWEGNERW